MGAVGTPMSPVLMLRSTVPHSRLQSQPDDIRAVIVGTESGVDAEKEKRRASVYYPWHKLPLVPLVRSKACGGTAG